MKYINFFSTIVFLSCVFWLNDLTAQSCLPDGITFTTQQEIDDFPANYPSCTEIAGNLIIENSDIANLNGLNQITSIGDSLVIRNNENLFDLSGLDNLTAIANDFLLYKNSSLANLDALNSLTSIGGDLKLGNSGYSSSKNNYMINFSSTYEGNDALSNITGLSNLDTIGGDIFIIAHRMLNSLSGLEGINTLNGSLMLIENDSITNLTGLDNLSTIGGDCIIGRAKILSAYDPFSIDVVYGTFYEGNDALNSLSGLGSLSSTGGHLVIGANPSLVDFNGLNNLQSTGRNLDVYDNAALVNFSGLENLSTIGEDIHIGLTDILIDYYGVNFPYLGNNALTSLNGLDNLNTINGHIGIQFNDNLENIQSLKNLDDTGITYINISFNDLLSVCNAPSICNYLNNGGNGYFAYNASGCNGSEVSDACSMVSINQPGALPEINILPNPTNGIFQISGITQGDYTIFNTAGQVVKSGQLTDNLFIDISNAPQGIYFIEIQNGKQTDTQRFVKQ